MEEKIPNRIINTSSLKIGDSYILQYGVAGTYTGKLIALDKRYSMHWIKEKTKDKNGKEIEIDVLEKHKPQYDVLIFESEEQLSAEKTGIVKRMFNHTLNPKRQIYFSNALIFHNNLIPIEIHDWAISKLLDVHGSKISNANLAITMKIAISRMKKENYSNYQIEYVVNLIKEKAIEIIDIKQYEWEKLLESQANTLPF